MDFIKQFFKGNPQNNNRVFPVTHIDAVRDNDGNPLSAYLNKRSAEYLTCTTAGATAAKEIALAGFVLLPNTFYAVLFTNAFVAADATLNINNTGAKPIKYYGVNVPNYVVKANTILTLVYDGTNYNVTNVEIKPKDDDLWVDLGLPSGVKWAKKNIDMSNANGFAANEFQYYCSYFSWGNIENFNPDGAGDTFLTDWGTSNTSGRYASSMGKKLTGSIPVSQDAARVMLSSPWRMPTQEEFAELVNNCDFIDGSGNVISSSTTDKRVTVNNIVGLYLQSKINGNRLFFPCSGCGEGTSLIQKGNYGRYWSSSFLDDNNGSHMVFYPGGVIAEGPNFKYQGMPIRPVQ